MISRLRTSLAAAILAVLAVGAVSCAQDPTTSGGNTTPIAVDRPLPQLAPDAWANRGQIVRAQPFELDGDPQHHVGGGQRVIYRSVSAYDGKATEVSGTVFVPKGSPPEGGWPVVAFAHGTTGLTQECGPSLYPDLKGYAETVASLTGEGYAVAFTDYQGLGTDGVHPYLEPRTAAFNVIDSVRALRHAFPDISTRWLALGGSQGGQAAWAANEYAKDYGSDLDLVGSLAVAPAVDLTAIAHEAQTGELSPLGISVMPLIIAGLEVEHPSLRESDYLRGAAAQEKQALISCSDKDSNIELSIDDVRPSSDAAADALLRMLGDNALPQRSLTAPMLVVNGSDDDMVRPEWVDAAVHRACELGGTVEHTVQQGRGHLDVSYGDQGTRWIRDRFDGQPAPSNCDATSRE